MAVDVHVSKSATLTLKDLSNSFELKLILWKIIVLLLQGLHVWMLSYFHIKYTNAPTQPHKHVIQLELKFKVDSPPHLMHLMKS